MRSEARKFNLYLSSSNGYVRVTLASGFSSVELTGTI